MSTSDTKRFCIGVDLGGTFIKLAVMAADDGQRYFGVTQVPTPAGSGEAVVKAMADGARGLMAAHQIDPADVLGVGVGSPGPLDLRRGVVVGAPNIPGLDGMPLRDRLAEMLELPVALENDANAAALGEFSFGAGRDARSMVLLTLGTGIGGGIVLDGKVVHGARDFAGEIGHMIVVPDGRPCKCGQRGCLEQYSSAGAIAATAAAAIADGANSSLAGVLHQKGSLDAADVNAARRTGDELAGKIWDQAVRYLALACVNLQRVFDCDLIVMAGGLTKAGDDLIEPLREHYRQLDWSIGDQVTPLTIAELGPDAGVVGAAGVALQAFGKRT